MSRTGIPALGYFAQVPHYVSGPYPGAALALLRSLGHHLGLDLPEGDLPDESRQLRSHLDSLAAGDATTRAYVERLESMVDEERLPTATTSSRRSSASCATAGRPPRTDRPRYVCKPARPGVRVVVTVPSVR